MTGALRPLALETARRLAVTKQHLAGGALRKRTPHDIISVLRDLVYVQLDTFSTVVPPQIIALWSRVDHFRPSDLDRLLLETKEVMETCPEPSGLGLVEDYPLYTSSLRGYPRGRASWWGRRIDRARAWLEAHDDLRRDILTQLEGNELSLNDFEGHVPTGRGEDGWSSGSAVATTLASLQLTGEVMVVRREGLKKVWGLPGDFLPPSVDRREIAWEEMEAVCARRAIRAMGVASRTEIYYYFPRGRYLHLPQTLKQLEASGEVQAVQITGVDRKETRYVDTDDMPLLQHLEAGGWEPRLSLLSPYDNLIMGRERGIRLFSFDYTHGNYLPLEKRRYGLYVLPILWGDRIIGRLDPRFDRELGVLRVNSVHAEPGCPTQHSIAQRIAETLERLANLVGADRVLFTPKVPRFWSSELC